MAFLKFIIVLMTIPAFCWTDTFFCDIGTECPPDMCCVGSPDELGTCRPLKSLGKACQMYSGVPSWGQSAGKVKECNCRDGLYCGSDNPISGLGRGTCRKMTYPR